MKYTRTMPKDDEQKKFPIVPEGEHKFQVVDIFSESEEKIVIKAEVISENGNGLSLLHGIDNNPESDFFWLTKLFLKCIGEPHNGDVEIDTDAWIGRQFCGSVKHSQVGDKTYANIKKLIYKDEKQEYQEPVRVKEPSDIKWDE